VFSFQSRPFAFRKSARRYGAGETTDSDLVPLMAGMKEKVKRTSRKPMKTWKN
jgi:hypothetical protein